MTSQSYEKTDRKRMDANMSGQCNNDSLVDFLGRKLEAAQETIRRLTEERDFAVKALRQMADMDKDVRDMQEATKYYEEMAIRLRRSLKELSPNAN